MIASGIVVLLTVMLQASPSPAVQGQIPSPPDIAEAFLARVARGEVDEALDNLPKGTLWASQKAQIEMLKTQIKGALGLYGAHFGIEKVREKSYTPSIVRLVYVMKREHHFLVWNFYFYRPKDRWEASGVWFLDQVHALE